MAKKQGEKPVIAGGRTLAKMRRGKSVTNNKPSPQKRKTWYDGPTLKTTSDGKTVSTMGNLKFNTGAYLAGAFAGQNNPYVKFTNPADLKK